MGISEQDFWNMTMHRFNLHIKAFQQKQKMKDEEMWIIGRYNMSAFETVMAHFGAGLSKKKSDAKYIEKPFTIIAEEKMITTRELTEEEIKLQREKYVENLKKQKESYDKRHGV